MEICNTHVKTAIAHSKLFSYAYFLYHVVQATSCPYTAIHRSKLAPIYSWGRTEICSSLVQALHALADRVCFL